MASKDREVLEDPTFVGRLPNRSVFDVPTSSQPMSIPGTSGGAGSSGLSVMVGGASKATTGPPGAVGLPGSSGIASRAAHSGAASGLAVSTGMPGAKSRSGGAGIVSKKTIASETTPLMARAVVRDVERNFPQHIPLPQLPQAPPSTLTHPPQSPPPPPAPSAHPPSPHQGISGFQAAVLIGGKMIGGGSLVLPRALTKTGWIGVPIIVALCLMAGFNTKRLGDCWSILVERDPELRTKKRNPYAIIAQQAIGRKWSAAVSMALVVTQFGVSVVYLLLAAELLHQQFINLVPVFNVCIWYLIATITLAPFLLFAMPKDFTFLGFFAFFCAVVSYILYFVELMSEYRPAVYRVGAKGFSDFFLGVGMMMFTFGGACSYPTLQKDMAEPAHFTRSIQLSSITTLGQYLMIAVGAYIKLGDQVAPNFALALQPTALTLVGNIIMTVHLAAGFSVLINPICEEMEILYNTPRDSVSHRLLMGVSLMIAVLFIGESIPVFYTILALVGGTAIALLVFILPSYCYLQIIGNTAGQTEPQSEPTPGWTKLLCWEVFVLGIVGGAFATYAALSAMFGASQMKPCYML